MVSGICVSGLNSGSVTYLEKEISLSWVPNLPVGITAGAHSGWEAGGLVNQKLWEPSRPILLSYWQMKKQMRYKKSDYRQERWLRDEGDMSSTISSYIRKLKTACNPNSREIQHLCPMTASALTCTHLHIDSHTDIYT